MDINKIPKDILGEPHLVRNGCLNADVFFYLAGRHPELTIAQAVDAVKLAREECADV